MTEFDRKMLQTAMEEKHRVLQELAEIEAYIKGHSEPKISKSAKLPLTDVDSEQFKTMHRDDVVHSVIKQSAGLKTGEIVKTLNEGGYPISAQHTSNSLFQLRKKKKVRLEGGRYYAGE